MTATWKTVPVFLSSTFRDMQAERDHLVRFVFPRLREELIDRRIHLLDVDLRWGVTTDQDASEVCREVVDECRPRFICILGGRYGCVPNGRSCSITADEIHYGVLDRDPVKRGFAYFYFRDPAATAAIVEICPGEFREPQGTVGQAALEDLKRSIVNADLNPSIYSALWDNQSRRLIGLSRFGDQVHDDLLQSMKSDPELQDRFITVPEKLEEYAEENAAMEAFIEEHTERFVLGSRQSLMNELLYYARGALSIGYLCVVGEPGSGKSSLLAHFSQQLNTGNGPSIFLVSHFVGASPGSTDVGHTLRRLCHELIAHAEITTEIPQDPQKLREKFSEILSNVCAKSRVVIVLDAVNELDSKPLFTGLEWLPDQLPDNARIILSAPSGAALNDLKQWRNPPTELRLDPLNAKDGEAIIEQFLTRYRKTLEPGQKVMLLNKNDAQTPLYLLAALEELRSLGTYEEITDRIAQLPAETKPLFMWILKRLEDDDGFRDVSNRKIGPELVRQFASLIAVSRHGLSQRELVELLAPDESGAIIPDDSQGNVAALLQLLRPYLMRRGELLDFYHSQFRRGAELNYLSSESESRAAHRELASYFLSHAYSVKNGMWNLTTQHAFSELLFHLKWADMWDELCSCLRDSTIFTYLWPGAYGVDFDKGVYFVCDSDALTPDSIRELPVNVRSRVGIAIAEGFEVHARSRIRQAQDFKQPWPQTAQYLRENDPDKFCAYRDTFYSFIRLAGKVAEFASAAFEESHGVREEMRDFIKRNGDINSFLNYLNKFGSEETGLSHALEDDAYPSCAAWEKLHDLAAPE